MPGGRDAQVCTNLLQQYQKLGTIQPVTTMRKLVTILQPACCCNNTWVSAIFPLIQTHIPHQHIYSAAITVCVLFSCQKHSFSETMMKRSDNSEERIFSSQLALSSGFPTPWVGDGNWIRAMLCDLHVVSLLLSERARTCLCVRNPISTLRDVHQQQFDFNIE